MHSTGKPKRTAVQLSGSCYLCCCRRVPSCCGLVIVCSRDPTRRGRLPSPRLWGSSSVSRLLTCTDRQQPCQHQQQWPWLYVPVESDIVAAMHGLAPHTHAWNSHTIATTGHSPPTCNKATTAVVQEQRTDVGKKIAICNGYILRL